MFWLATKVPDDRLPDSNPALGRTLVGAGGGGDPQGAVVNLQKTSASVTQLQSSKARNRTSE